MILFRIFGFIFAIYAVEASFRSQIGLMRRQPSRLFSASPQSIQPSLLTDPRNILNFLHTVEHLKLEKRTGWHKCGIPFEKSESIADHMYRMAIMACTVQDSNIDKFKAVKMALVHDMAEAIVGDITPGCGVSEDDKHQREADAMQSIREMLGDNPFGAEAQSLWMEYAADVTKEAQFVKDIDKTELYVQVVEYENKFGINFQEWLSRARPKIRHPGLQAIADAVELERPAEFRALLVDAETQTTETGLN